VKLRLPCLFLAAVLLAGTGLAAAERIPPVPAGFFNDYAGVVPAGTADDLNRQLQQYERESSNQLLVAVYAKMESASSVEDYTVRIAQAWKVGQAGKNNGAVLFVFKDDHKLFIQVGYGLEATLTDARAHEIVENILKPRFRAGNYDAGLREAVGAMIAATKGEYRGTGRTHAESSPGFTISFQTILTLFVILWVVISMIRAARRGVVYSSRRRSGLGGIFWTGGGGGGGGFSGGGGSFGGGGAGGSW